MTEPARICVVKFGGSLLASDQLPRRLRQWLAAETADHDDTHYVLLVGGGTLVDAVRELDARQHLDEQAAHWICVELLDVTAGLLSAILPDIAVTDDYRAMRRRCDEAGVTMFRPSRFLKEIEPYEAGTRLTASWQVTSDAIAARLAIVLGADELVLVKSVPPPEPDGDKLDQLAAAGYVDRFLTRLSGEMPPLRFETLNH